MLILALLAFPFAVSGAAQRGTAPEGLSEAPAIEDLKARFDWAGREAGRLQARIATQPRDALAHLMLAALAVVVATDLERALARGDRDSAIKLRTLVKDRLAAAGPLLGDIGRHGAGGGDFALAVMSLHGILEPRNAETACRLFSSAWDKGFSDAAYRLAGCLPSQDHARAEALLYTAAAAGHAGAREDLGRHCLESNPRDVPCAVRQIAAAATAGRASAKSLLGWMTAQGLGVKRDPGRALALYLEAAEAGDLSARNNLGELYETGRGVMSDPSRAFTYYRAAAEAGFAPAQFNLARMYAGGTGITRDLAEARKWTTAALRSGIQPAQKLLDWIDAQEAKTTETPAAARR